MLTTSQPHPPSRWRGWGPLWYAARALIALAWVVFACAGTSRSGVATEKKDDKKAACTPCYICPGDSVWIINTRSSVDCCDIHQVTYQVLKCGSWCPSSLAEFSAAEHSRTCVFVHGNRIEAHEAPQLGMGLYCRILQKRTCKAPTRFVIWSWPSDRIIGPLRDAHAKAELSTVESFHLARFLGSLSAGETTSLIGFSYGAQVILGSTHLLAGGTLQCRSLSCAPHSLLHLNVVLAASAVDTKSLCPGCALGSALVPISRLTLVNNSLDPVLRRYHIAIGQPGIQAIGVSGLAYSNGAAVHQSDFASHLHRTHSWERHVQSARVLRYMQQGAELY